MVLVSILLQYRFVLVIALLAFAAALLAGPDRLPLALRGLRRALGARARTGVDSCPPISRGRRVVAFVLVVLAFIVAVVGG